MTFRMIVSRVLVVCDEAILFGFLIKRQFVWCGNLMLEEIWERNNQIV